MKIKIIKIMKGYFLNYDGSLMYENCDERSRVWAGVVVHKKEQQLRRNLMIVAILLPTILLGSSYLLMQEGYEIASMVLCAVLGAIIGILLLFVLFIAYISDRIWQ